MTRAPSVVVAGSMAQRPRHGGHTWMLLQYLLGFRRLGWEVTFLDLLEPEMCGRPRSALSPHARFLARTLRAVGLDGSFALYCDGGREIVGLTHEQVRRRVRRAAFVLNFMGFFTEASVLDEARRKVLLDIDPGYTQMWQALGQADVTAGHDTFVTIAENIDLPSCRIPSNGRRWITTRPPVVLESWPVVDGGRRSTTVATWRGPYGPLEYNGKTYGARVHEFRKFAALPRLAAGEFELALDIDPAEERDLDLLAENGWSLVDPAVRAGNPDAYRRYIQRSRAEFCVAKNIYVETRSGWVSDRSVCYLASGKPVLAQDTGFSRNYPTGEGLLAFTSLEEALASLEGVEGNYPRHSAAARRFAEEYFDSDKVLPRLLDRIGVG